MKQKKILIIGAGISGLSLAINLQRMKIPFRIIEKQTNWKRKGLAMSIQGEGLNAAASLDILEEIKQKSTKRNLSRIYDPSDKVLKNIATNSHDMSFVIRRDVIHNALRARVPKIKMGISVSNITEKKDLIEVLFSDSSSDTFSMVVGADGINSKTRKYVLDNNINSNNKDLQYSGSVLWGFTLPQKYNEIFEVWDTNKMCATYPVENGTVFSFFMNVPESFSSPKQERQKYLKKHFSSFSNSIVQNVLHSLPENIFFDKVRYSRPAQWNRGKVTLVGDSCHSLSPLSGLGANLAMADAEGLVQVIKLSNNDEDLSRHLNIFNSVRKVEADKAYYKSKLRTARGMMPLPWKIIRNIKMKQSGWEY